MDGGCERLPAGFELAIEQRELAAFVEEGLHRSRFALLPGKPDIEVAQPLEHGQVRTAREGFLAGGNDAALDRLARDDMVDDLVQLGHDLGGDDVHRTAGHVPDQGRNAVGVGLEAEIGEVHRFSPLRADQTRSMMVATPMPAATQSVTSAVCLFVRSSSSSTVPRIIAPVAPSGWPIAMAPPLTLRMASSMSKAC